MERFRKLPRIYFRNTHGIILTYDISIRDSFLHLDDHLHQIHESTDFQPKIILVGHKADLESQRKISFEEGMNFAQNHNLMFIEASAKQYINIENIFNSLTAEILNTPTLVNRSLKLQNNSLRPNNQIKPFLFKKYLTKCYK